MWSGPRNISTAMMRAWGNRTDCAVTDEPLYAHYLVATGLPHPARDATLAAHEADWRKVAAWLTGPVPGGKPIWYQKHMTHHLLENIGPGWLDDLTHAFLIREPSAMLVSLAEFLPHPALRDTGLPQQLRIFEYVRDKTGRIPPVIDGNRILHDPPGMLARLCAALDVPFDPAMLAWPPGLRDTDGAWAGAWYGKVAQTTSFGPPRDAIAAVPTALAALYDDCADIYRELAQYSLTA